MDDHQREMWHRMIALVDRYEPGDGIALGKLVSDLRGLFIEADPQDSSTRSEFEIWCAPIDGEHELRTEPWAPAGAANDDRLNEHLAEFRRWVNRVLDADAGTENA